jgi:putative ABC transport system substrate-binding protein
MKRREFITLLGGAAVTPSLCSRAAHAQEVRKAFRIGYLGNSTASLESRVVDAFRQRLRNLGYVEGQNIAIEYRWAEGENNRLPKLASELVRLKPDVIVAAGTPGILAVKRATNTIPIVFASSGNPVTNGLVASFARPGGNITGFTISGPEIEGKRVQILKDAVPQLSRFAVLWNPDNPAILEFYQQMRAAAAALNLTVQPVAEVRHPDELGQCQTLSW